MKNTFVLLLAAAAISASCNRGSTTTAGGTSKPTVALVLKTLNHPFFVDMRRGAQEAADRPRVADGRPAPSKQGMARAARPPRPRCQAMLGTLPCAREYP